MLRAFSLLIAICLLTGCTDRCPKCGRQVSLLTGRHVGRIQHRAPRTSEEIPVCNIPRELRVQNYKGGSCVHASTAADFNWLHQYELSRWWHDNYSGGESYNGLTSKLRKHQIKFYDTANGDVSILDRCTAERRMATIFYYPNHSISFVGWHGGYAYVLDNNRVDEWIRIPRDTFIKNWRGYGGVAVVPDIADPLPPLPWKAKA